jgi:hypothetical protein
MIRDIFGDSFKGNLHFLGTRQKEKRDYAADISTKTLAQHRNSHHGMRVSSQSKLLEYLSEVMLILERWTTSE